MVEPVDVRSIVQLPVVSAVDRAVDRAVNNAVLDAVRNTVFRPVRAAANDVVYWPVYSVVREELDA